MKIVECKVWCVDYDADEKNREAGTRLHDTNDRWSPYAFDLSQVRSIKETGSNYFIEEGQASSVTFKDGSYATININYYRLLKIWKE